MTLDTAEIPETETPPKALRTRRDASPAVDLQMATVAAITDLRTLNDPPYLFSYGDAAARLTVTAKGRTVLEHLTPQSLRGEMAKASEWVAPRKTKEGIETTEARPPMDVAVNVLTVRPVPFPHLERMVDVPVYTDDGRLLCTPGYDAPSGILYRPAKGLRLWAVRDVPTTRDVALAKGIFDDLTADFPFATPADKTNALGLYLLPYLRDLIGDPTPLHLIESPDPGSGKDLLANVLTGHAGGIISAMTEAESEGEWRKQITSMLVKGTTICVIGNVSRDLRSAALAAALTQPQWDDRLLGGNVHVSFAMRLVWIATGNNPTLKVDIARRTVPIRLDPGIERPWERTAFRHKKLRRWATRNRSRLVWAALTLIQSWIAAGRPLGNAALGSYEEWAPVMSGVLGHIGVPDFLGNVATFYDAADMDSAIWRAFVGRWWETFGAEPVETGRLFSLAADFEGIDLGKGGERSQRTVFGMWVGRKRDTVAGGYRLAQATPLHGQPRWQLIPVGEAAPDA